MKPSLLILTKPSHKLDKFKFLISNLLGSQCDLDQSIHGHPGVTRSLLDGLTKLKVSFVAFGLLNVKPRPFKPSL